MDSIWGWSSMEILRRITTSNPPPSAECECTFRKVRSRVCATHAITQNLSDTRLHATFRSYTQYDLLKCVHCSHTSNTRHHHHNHLLLHGHMSPEDFRPPGMCTRPYNQPNMRTWFLSMQQTIATHAHRTLFFRVCVCMLSDVCDACRSALCTLSAASELSRSHAVLCNLQILTQNKIRCGMRACCSCTHTHHIHTNSRREEWSRWRMLTYC